MNWYFWIGLLPGLYLAARFWRERRPYRYVVATMIMAWLVSWLLWLPMMVAVWLKFLKTRC